jgi:cation/acetate symporter
VDRLAVLEEKLLNSPAEQQVRAEYLRRAKDYEARLADVDAALVSERNAVQARILQLKAQRADMALVMAAHRELAALPRDADAARETWARAMHDNYERAKPLGGLPSHSRAFSGDPDGSPAEQEEFRNSRNNFLALMFCLMVGTAGLPHLLVRYYTTPTVAEARSSVAWSLFFIVLLYVSAPALAALVKFEVMQGLVGNRFDALPAWMAQWSRVEGSLLSVSDVNGDGILQFGELRMGADLIMLATPELGGLPYVISGLVAAGGLAAALSTADGLLLTISNSLVRDLYFEGGLRGSATPEQRVILSKFALLAVAMVAAFVAALKPAEILPLVSASFSMAAAAFVPAMVCGIFWQRTTREAALAGMLSGLGLTVYYMLINAPALRGWLGLAGPAPLWLGIQPISAAVFGVPLGVAVIIAVTWLRGTPSKAGRGAGDRPAADGL